MCVNELLNWKKTNQFQFGRRHRLRGADRHLGRSLLPLSIPSSTAGQVIWSKTVRTRLFLRFIARLQNVITALLNPSSAGAIESPSKPASNFFLPSSSFLAFSMSNVGCCAHWSFCCFSSVRFNNKHLLFVVALCVMAMIVFAVIVRWYAVVSWATCLVDLPD